MNYEDRVVCFLDVLGFQYHIERTVNKDGSDVEQNIDNLAQAFLDIRDLLDIDRPDERLGGQEVTQFSDSLVISFPAIEESGVFFALLNILWVQMNLARHGLLVRGAVARGKLIHNLKVLFGPALIEAYLLETKAALYPRVIVSKSIIDLGISKRFKGNLPQHEEESIMDILKKDSDGMYYVDYLTKAQGELNEPELDYPLYLGTLQQIIAHGLEVKDPSIAIKYQWMKEKFEPHLKIVKGNAAKMWHEEDDLGIAYESIPDF